MEKLFTSLYSYFEKSPLKLFISFAVCFLLVGYFALKVKFEEDISKVLPHDKKVEKLNQVFQNSKFMDKLVVMVSLNDTTAVQPDSLVAFADAFASAVQGQLSPYVRKVDARIDDGMVVELFNTISNHLPVYLTENDYQTIDTLISPIKLRQTLEENYRTLASPAGIALKTMISQDPVGISFIGMKRLQQLQYDENFELYDSYLVTKDHRQLLLFVTPAYPSSNTGKNALLLKGLDHIIDSLGTAVFPAAHADYFGTNAVSVGNALQIRKDSLMTQGITVVLLVVSLGVYFRRKRAPFLILIPVLFGALFSLTAIYFLKGSISVIALGSGSVVLGIAVNYSLHVFNHYRHVGSIRQVIKDLSFPLTIGSFTTIGGFFCLQFVGSEMLNDVGLFAAFSLVGASLCSLIFLPHLIHSKKHGRHSGPNFSWLDKIASFRPEYNKYIIVLIFLLTAVFAYFAQFVSFESDMMHMNYMSEKLTRSEARLNKVNEFALHSVYLVAEGKTLQDALKTNEHLIADIEKLKGQRIVKKYSGVSALLVSDSLQKERLETWNRYWTKEKKQRLFQTLEREGAALGYRTAAFDQFKALLNKDFQPVTQEEMADIRNNLLNDFITEGPQRSTVVTLVKVDKAGKQKIYDAFDKNTAVTVLDKQSVTEKFVEIISSDFSSIAWMSSLLVFAVLLLTYGRIELALVSFIPMFVSWIWILGIMGLTGIPFNIINVIISALIFGLGDDYSLFVMDGLLGEYKTGKKNLSSYKSSIFLSAITTVTGLGVLIFTQHPALKSIAVISIIGILCVVVMSQILIPFFFRVLIKNRTEKGQYPLTLLAFLKSVFAFSYFVFGSFLLTVLGVVLLKINPFRTEKSRVLFHRTMAGFARSLVYTMANVKKQIINPQKENFSKPAVIIANHQSFLDILCMVMLHPKLILFTNDWVWNSPVFGAVVRMAGYYPVTQGAENSLDLLAERVRQGYSIVVFPEGTRSSDGCIKRFHKGAFYLAEKLNLEILPIVIHGTGDTMSKGDFLLKDGSITLKFLPRISASDRRFGASYSERAKTIGRYFRGAYQELRDEVEQPAYFRERLLYNYLYKGPVLEWYLRVKVSLEKSYQIFHSLLPKQGRILDIGCGYGFMSYLLHFAAPRRIITAVDYDREKIEAAQLCFSRDETICFKCANVLDFPFQTYDAIILADVLHYLQPEEQKQVMEKCIRHLSPGGMILVRDGVKELKERHKGTRLTEFFSTKLIGFNKTNGKGLSFLSGSSIKEVAAAHFLDCRQIDNTKFTSNLIFVLQSAQTVEA